MKATAKAATIRRESVFRCACLGALLTALALGQVVHAGVVFSYDASTGEFPSDQGWTAYEIDTTGPLTDAGVPGTMEDNANAAMEVVDGMSVLHLRDTLTDSTANLPVYAYPWTSSQQQQLIDYGLKFTMVFQGLPTSTSGKGNVRFGFNNTEFELQLDNIDADQTIEVLGLSAELAPNDGQFHTLEILGQRNGSNFDFSWSFDGGESNPLDIKGNPAPSEIESAVYFGANSSGNAAGTSGTGTDILVKSVVMETLVPEPSAILSLLAGAIGVGAITRRRR